MAKTFFVLTIFYPATLWRDRREWHVSLLSSDSNPRKSVELHQTLDALPCYSEAASYGRLISLRRDSNAWHFFQLPTSTSETHPSPENLEDPFKIESEPEVDQPETDENGCLASPEVFELGEHQHQVSAPEPTPGISLFNEESAEQVGLLRLCFRSYKNGFWWNVKVCMTD